MENGTYRVYRVRIDANGNPNKSLTARFLVNNGFIHYLEDDGDMISDILAPGEITGVKNKRFESLQNNPYLQLVHEDDLAAGHHPEFLQTMDLGSPDPEASFDLTFGGEKHLLEVHPGCTVLDGKTLSDEETKSLMLEIKNGSKLLESRG